MIVDAFEKPEPKKPEPEPIIQKTDTSVDSKPESTAQPQTEIKKPDIEPPKENPSESSENKPK